MNLMGKKGQSGTVFKLLIAAAFSMMLLVIAYGYVQSMRPPVAGIEAAEAVLNNAVEAPGKCFSREPVMFQQGQPYSPGMLDQDRFTRGENFNEVVTEIGILDKDDVVRTNAESSISAKCSNGCTLWIGSSTCGEGD